MSTIATTADGTLHSPRSTVDKDAPFLLSRPETSVRTSGVAAEFSAAQDAIDALRSGRAGAIVGALPFAENAPCALTVPVEFTRIRGDLRHDGAAPLPAARIVDTTPNPAEHAERVRRAITALQAGTLDKVVLARSLTVGLQSPLSPTDLARRLIQLDHSHNGFHVDLSAAGGRFRGRALVGSTPEVLIERKGDVVTCHPLAGSLARHPNPTIDAANARDLEASAKDRAEHAFVVDSIMSILGPLCRSISAPHGPELLRTPQLWHLGTKIEGVLADPDLTALELAVALHPTPAVCGTPTATARKHIAQTEDDRGFYAGAVGWCDRSGDGEWMVAIRCAEVAPDGLSARAFAGGGIVATSDPDAEVNETTTKFKTVLAAFGLTG
ncbi:isochorismate synthase [Rhodococcus sp. 27YEA15]|uniref:isochorismate synthase n=1 Tax=Rhodococcus sp. 27YEA15 TaxID=3156259 RepID=UPI003C7D36AC